LEKQGYRVQIGKRTIDIRELEDGIVVAIDEEA
jgi:hypothetical protein